VRRTIALVLIGLAASTACSKKSGGAGSKACASPPPSIAAPSGLPSAFPAPSGVVYTSSMAAGPSTIVQAYADNALTDVFNSYASALGQAPYGVTKKEHDAHDAEVAFAGSGTTGQVKLGEACQGRTSIQITVRPA
jgi:hypothetical protein